MAITEYETWAAQFPPGTRKRVADRPGLGIVVQADDSLRWTFAEKRWDAAEGKNIQRERNLAARSWREALDEYKILTGKQTEGTLVIARGDKYVTDALAAFLAEFEDKVKLGLKKRATYVSYEVNTRLHLVPNLHGVRLKDLTSERIQKLSTDLQREGYEHNTRDNMLKPLKGAVKYGIRRGWLGFDPFQGVDRDYMPKQRPRKGYEPRLLRNEELGEMFRNANHLYVNAVILMAYTGLRIGELCGLQWKDIHLDEQYLRVEAQLGKEEGSDEWTQVDPKSLALREWTAVRDVGLLPLAAEALERQRVLEQAKGYGRPGDWVFTTSKYHGIASGNPLMVWNFRKRGVQQAALDGGIGHVRPHDLRHTTASILAAHNVPNTDAAKWMGHTVATYEAEYAKSFADAESRRRTLETLIKAGHGVGLRLVKDVA